MTAAMLTIISTGFYIRDCQNLYLMDVYIRDSKSLSGFEFDSFPFVGLNAFWYAFKSMPKRGDSSLSIPMYKEQVDTIHFYRKFYLITWPILIAIIAIGITIDWILVNK